MSLSDLQDIVGKCTLCNLSANRQVPVFAKGNPFSKIMLCGMCPGPEENDPINEYGWPFIGRSGKLLNNILEDVGLTLKDIYITNVVKCYQKPGIRLSDECINTCFQYLISQITEIKPKVIVTLGSDAARALLNKPKSTSLSSMRGKRYKFTDDISIIASYHPSYFLRLGGRKHKYYEKILDDLSWVKEIINREE